MGLFSFIGSCISSIGSAIGSVVSGAMKVCGGIVKGAVSGLSKIGGAIGGLASKAAGFLGGLTGGLTAFLAPVFGPLAPIISDIIVNVLTNVLMNLLMDKGEPEMEEEEIEEYGFLMEESANHPEWPKEESFSSAKEHYLKLKELAEGENIHMTEAKRFSAESLRRRTMGMAALWERLERREGITIAREFLVHAGLKMFDKDQFRSVLDASKELGYTTVPYMDFKEGKMNPEEEEKYIEAVVNKIREVKAENGETLDIVSAYKEFNDMKTNPDDKFALERYKPLWDKFETESPSTLYDVNSLKAEYKEYNLQDELETLDEVEKHS